MDKSKINASIVTYRTSLTELASCLRSLLASAAVLRVDVIDNASEQCVADLCKEYGDRVHYMANDNVGFGRGHNIAMRRTLECADAEYHLVINADVYFDQGTLEGALEYMDRNSDVGQLSPHTLFPNGEFQPVCHPVPSPLELMLHRFTPLSWCRKRRDRYELRTCDMSREWNVPVHHGCFMLLRTSALREVGLFDERYFMYGEDFDLTRRMHSRYRTMYYPQVSIYHRFKAESRINMRLFRIHCVSMLKYFAKWGFFIDKERVRFNRRLWNDMKRPGERP